MKTITSVLLTADIPTKNGNIYPLKILKDVAEKAQPLIESDRMLGQVGMPDSPDVNLPKGTHLVVELKVVENELIGTATILDESIDPDKYVLRTAGIGDVIDHVVQDDYKLICVNLVLKEDAA